ncbi:uncharacterized protein N7458_008868 [Penicillium daleae]|uniref:Uncharacterized protein n=1 Tax=Penicillium daleae TaxID=63821 RepID=A0AAD6BWH9_9EURO|nr:uncharacterized protein N7458_008868 [Penicillium daleae]KAJ5437870.1 hypothetical protein N7458_008868 [Penicillium daleae]
MAQAPPTFTPDSEFAELETPRGPKAGSLSITALARFEFEAGKGNEGTKILMVEWEDDDLARSTTDGSWHVSWAGKTTVLPADERPSESTRRFYFLLPPHVTIPPVVTLSYKPRQVKTNNDGAAPALDPRDILQLNPLPAIFPPELGATGRSAGKKGVLHTIWAKKRLRVLEKEIREECLTNAEGVALHMAVQEKEWIEGNFGLSPRGVENSHDSSNSSSTYPTGPATPVSPVSGRKLMDKLKGLKLQTSERDLSAKDGAQDQDLNSDRMKLTARKPGPSDSHLLSPQSPDVAVSSFSSFRSIANRAPHSMPTPDTNPTPTPSLPTNPTGPESFRPVALHPPESVQEAQQSSRPEGFAAIGSMTTIARTSSADSGDDLFAKALSPRSPDLPRSPFSFA